MQKSLFSFGVSWIQNHCNCGCVGSSLTRQNKHVRYLNAFIHVFTGLAIYTEAHSAAGWWGRSAAGWWGPRRAPPPPPPPPARVWRAPPPPRVWRAPPLLDLHHVLEWMLHSDLHHPHAHRPEFHMLHHHQFTDDHHPLLQLLPGGVGTCVKHSSYLQWKHYVFLLHRLKYQIRCSLSTHSIQYPIGKVFYWNFDLVILPMANSLNLNSAYYYFLKSLNDSLYIWNSKIKIC